LLPAYYKRKWLGRSMKTILTLASVTLAVLLAGGVARAATIQCPNGPITEIARYCYGTNQPDTMHGTSGSKRDRMWGEGGGDTMYGYGTVDRLVGGRGSDKLYGGSETDSLRGSECAGAAGCTYSDSSNDYVHGGKGGDEILGGYAQGGVDRIYGEGGNDDISASQKSWLHNGRSGFVVTKEIIDCGPGSRDEVWFDRGVDVVKENCEKKHGYPTRG
jgi:Ca2+-binding RTX toxin-like protein